MTRRTLAVDTATRTQVVALLDGDAVLEHRQRLVRYNHGSSLLGTLQEVLGAQRLGVSDCDLLVVGLGPGSFTGLRVGMATVKALGRAASVPVVGVSTLHAIAHPAAIAHPGAPIFAAIDAHRGQIYAGVFQADADGVSQTIVAERAWSEGELLKAFSEHEGAQFLGQSLAKYPALLDAVTLAPAWASVPHGAALAELGRAQFETQGAADLASLEPNYIRKSDAEINLEKRQASA